MVTCTVQKIINPETPFLTVGERFFLNCTGESFSNEPKITVDNPTHPWQIKILSQRTVGDKELQIQAVSAIVGEHSITGLKIDGQPVSPFNLSVRSVQDPQNIVTIPFAPQMLPAGYPPLFPMVTILIVIVGLLGLLWYPSWMVRKKKKKYAAFLQTVNQQISPLEEFQLSLYHTKRRLYRNSPSESSLDDQFLHQLTDEFFQSVLKFLGRIYKEPLVFGDWDTLTFLEKKISKRSNATHDELIRFLEEIKKIRTRPVTVQELQFLFDWFRDLAPQLVLEGKNR
ncbi:MAG: hypothetical protein NZ480_09065 [Bdellovibrionaceae bacterium]|nr:hypothetical protein [Pseudobdellovibrionaceae bacterium]MDW8189616.1 hypothetical protein [Pseudobdellovibrionaceae bacterium]